MRLMCLNHGGLLLEPGGPREVSLFQAVRHSEIDVLLLQELGINWHKMGRPGQWQERIKKALNAQCTRS